MNLSNPTHTAPHHHHHQQHQQHHHHHHHHHHQQHLMNQTHHSNSTNNININSNSNNSNHHAVGLNAAAVAANQNAKGHKDSRNVYRIGDCVYFETTSTTSYQIGRIDELYKAENSNAIEVKAVCFFRRRDISSSLITLADKQQYDEHQEAEIEQMSEKAKHLLKQRELFYSRQIGTLPASSIRGKCTVQLLNESESLASYINKEDHFFYTLVYDPQQKTLLADRGEIRVGQRYQAEVQPKPIYIPTQGGDAQDTRDSKALETLVYTPDHDLSDEQINKFLTIAKSVGTFARALDCNSSIKQPSLHLTAASASRDVTLLYAMSLLHKNNYDLAKAVCALVPSTGPVLCRDEIEEWSAAEASLFEEAIEKYGREFGDIRQDFLPWKSIKNIIEYYYMWKTTDRSVQQKKMKAIEAENKVKQVFIPNSNKHNSMNGLPDGHALSSYGRPCESCGQTSSSQWHSWGSAHMQCRLCNECWVYWKKYGGLKFVDIKEESKPTVNDSKSSPSVNKAPTAVVSDTSSPSANVPVDAANVSKQNDIAPSVDGQYPCLECNKVFNRQERLTAHLASHRPYRCEISSCLKEFRLRAHLARHCAIAHGVDVRANSPRPPSKPDRRQTFYYLAPVYARNIRRLLAHLVRPRFATRHPFLPINLELIRKECAKKFVDGVPNLEKCKLADRGKINDVSHRCGIEKKPTPDWLVLPTEEEMLKRKPSSYAFPRTLASSTNTTTKSLLIPIIKSDRGSDVEVKPAIILPSSPRLPISEDKNHNSLKDSETPIKLDSVENPAAGLKRSHDNSNGDVENPEQTVKRRQITAPAITGTSEHQNKDKKLDGIYFLATKAFKQTRRLTISDLKHISRKPWERLSKLKY